MIADLEKDPGAAAVGARREPATLAAVTAGVLVDLAPLDLTVPLADPCAETLRLLYVEMRDTAAASRARVVARLHRLAADG